MHKVTKKLDDVKFTFSDVNVEVLPAQYDVNIYNNTKFSIIPESIWKGAKPFITEKTWRSIACKHPFVMASTPGTLRYLENLGYKTFENYLKQYDHIVDSNERLKVIVQNTKFMIENDLTFMNDDVEHNYNLFFEQADQTADQVTNIVHNLFK